MTPPPSRPRRAVRLPWSLERLLHERALALENALDRSTHSSYSSALNSYLSFCDRQKFPIDPTEHTLSLYVIYECHHIEPRSVDSYLSGICSELEPFYPAVRKIRSSTLVSRTLRGAKRLYSQPVKRKRALTPEDLELAFTHFSGSSQSYDDNLFLTQLLTGFHGLMRLGELVWPDSLELRTFFKVSRRTAVALSEHSYEFSLRTHKSDKQFSGDTVLVHDSVTQPHVVNLFTRYLSARDRTFPCRAELWLRHNGTIPTRSWFIRRLRSVFHDDLTICGHSMRAGGATALALAGVPGSLIQATGRWSSSAWELYVRKHPVLMHALTLAKQRSST
ncbi:hypothetical protein OH76DRAFT_638510 [Lentinus brumalis]|uniref:DNA breaking-rejoining enzyme n=1 Tax=Lentinus brumalis TaxID=2498619 RepID=A0A371D8M9_9APHY|nr:hypothetical protein OH76DRAFT_638510 [Polyporus brumalis]